MTETELIEKTQLVLGDEKLNALVPTYVEFAKQAITNKMFPYDPNKTYEDVGSRWDVRVIEIAVVMITKRGAEGEVVHSENGTTRNYGTNASVPQSLLADIPSFVGVPK